MTKLDVLKFYEQKERDYMSYMNDGGILSEAEDIDFRMIQLIIPALEMQALSLDLQVVINKTNEDEMALVNLRDRTVIVRGNAIYGYIEGFLDGLKYAGVSYNLNDEPYAVPNMDIFKMCDIYNLKNLLPLS